MKYVDPSGRWPTDRRLPVHQRAIDRALSFVAEQDRAILRAQQVIADEDQSIGGSYKHAMRGTGQSCEEARNLTNNWVRGNLMMARRLEKSGRHREALEFLGNAIHILQDETSPVHRGFQPWHGLLGRGSAAHPLIERFDPGLGSELDQVTRQAWDYFTGNLPLPRDFFPLSGCHP